MEEYPRTLQELEARFATEEAEAWSTRRGLRMCVACGHQVSVTAGTIFQGTRMPIGRLILWGAGLPQDFPEDAVARLGGTRVVVGPGGGGSTSPAR